MRMANNRKMNIVIWLFRCHCCNEINNHYSLLVVVVIVVMVVAVV